MDTQIEDVVITTIPEKKLEITLPWQDNTLSQNARPNRWEKSSAKRQAKEDAFYCAKLALDARPSPFDPKAPIEYYLSFTPPDRRYIMDQDNSIAIMKAALDGIALALEVDDKIFKLGDRPVIWNLPKRPGHVTVILTQNSVRNAVYTPSQAHGSSGGGGIEA